MANQQPQPFNPNDHLMKIGRGEQAKDYLPVQWRLVWFREHCPNGSIETEIVQIDLDRETEEEVSVWNNEKRRSEKVIKRAPGFAMFRATIKDGKGGVATGTKSEKAASFPDFIEKAETGSIGRALAALGYGTQFTGDEFDEKHRIVDAPVDNATASTPKPQDVPASKPVEKPAQTAPKPQASENKPAEQAKEAPIPTVSQLRALAAKHIGPNAFNAVAGTLQATYQSVDLKVDDAWEEKHCKHAYELLKKQINEKKQALAKAS